ncbi:MAG TPA: HDOD domain-containing protein [Phycisphaerae bacterium]|nr:HDOD domain-containing protein [Phycisphaerae bacterium]HUU23206.1 HDOD domain-containing protein [Phycisphaerae bacterium]
MSSSATERAAAILATTRPIFDRLSNVYGYEVDLPSGFGPELAKLAAEGGGGIGSWRSLGFDGIMGLGRGHLTFPRGLLIEQFPVLFPPEVLVVGVPRDPKGDRELLDACRQLKDVGYELELVNFLPGQMDSPFLDFGDMVRVSASLPRRDQAEICEKLVARGIRTIATGVDTPRQHENAVEAGFWYFQGDFFRRPILTSAQELPSQKAHYLALLKEVSRPELVYDELETIIRLDVAMTYRLLRFINSAWHGLRQTVDSVRHALVLLGPREVRWWASMLILRELGDDKPKELFRRCLIRAKMAEGIAPLIGLGAKASELFLTGMFSLVEALTNVPLTRVLEGLPLNEDIKLALLIHAGPYGPVYEAVEHYELGEWDQLAGSLEELELDKDALPEVFVAAVRWADNAVNSM